MASLFADAAFRDPGVDTHGVVGSSKRFYDIDRTACARRRFTSLVTPFSSRLHGTMLT